MELSGGRVAGRDRAHMERRESLDSSAAYKMHNDAIAIAATATGHVPRTHHGGRPVPPLRRQPSAAPIMQQHPPHPHRQRMLEEEDRAHALAVGQGGGGGGTEEGEGLLRGPVFMDRRLNSPMASVKASIINELSSKLQQMGGWQGQEKPPSGR